MNKTEIDQFINKMENKILINHKKIKDLEERFNKIEQQIIQIQFSYKKH